MDSDNFHFVLKAKKRNFMTQREFNAFVYDYMHAIGDAYTYAFIKFENRRERNLVESINNAHRRNK